MKQSVKDRVKQQTPGVAAAETVATSSLLSDEELKTKSIFFATPCYGGQLTDQYHLSMFRLMSDLQRHQIGHQITTLRNESLITRGRNILAAMFLDSPCTHLMFIDADIEFEGLDVIKLLRMDESIAVGAYPKKTLPIQYAVNLKIT